jgi:hypothetical protein
MKIVNRNHLWISDIANPGHGPFFAVHVKANGKEYVLTDNRALFPTYEAALPLFNKIWAKGEFNPDLWERTTMTEDERYGYYGPDGQVYEWEEMEKMNGNW